MLQSAVLVLLCSFCLLQDVMKQLQLTVRDANRFIEELNEAGRLVLMLAVLLPACTLVS